MFKTKDRLTGWIQKQDLYIYIYMWSTMDPLEIQGHVQTESEGMKEDILCKWKSKESWSSNVPIRQNKL